MKAYCAEFKLAGKAPDGKPVEFQGYSEHVWIIEKVGIDRSSTDMLHFAADHLNVPIGELCQIVADLGGTFEYDENWFEAHVPMRCVQSIAFEDVEPY